MFTGIGPLRAIELIKKYGSIEEIIRQLDPSKYVIPDGFFYEKVREVFKNPAVVDPDKIEVCHSSCSYWQSSTCLS